MIAILVSNSYICARCLRANKRIGTFPARTSIRRVPTRLFANSATQAHGKNDRRQYSEQGTSNNGVVSKPAEELEHKDEGAMTRRLRDMSEDALQSGSRSNQKEILEAGFSEDLKRQLEERIADANFRAANRSAFVEAELPSHVGRGTRDVAAAEPWSGTESIHDASLRMLNDAHKPLRSGRSSRIPGPAAPPPKRVDTGRSTNKPAAGVRLANARDRSGLYSTLKDSNIDEQERQKRFQELKDRFSPNARAVVPGTIQGLASLANERIEDAIARGQFKNIPRGQKIERDHNASSPFLDTTEYFMNKIIQRQDIVPPWIEKQQELVSIATKFRSRLRNDWRRHAARMIASKGGTLVEQMTRAEAYAKAELIANPPRKKTEEISTVDSSGHISQISVSGELKVPSAPSSGAPMVEEVAAERTSIGEKINEIGESPTSHASNSQSEGTAMRSISVQVPTPSAEVPPAPFPFRDPNWESIEFAYQSLAINDLNSKTRSYNLQAPDLAKKPYYSLQRELNACYADIAPQLAEAIKDRALAPKRKLEGFGDNLAGGGGSTGVMDRLVGERVRVSDERVERRYGFRQFWKDVWGSG